ncbi:MAG: hypothetical protein HYW06_02465, partial [Gemmatimonadetes bacterium]|nr:hypothetical protein [Gemmatimonadota bacterium]
HHETVVRVQRFSPSQFIGITIPRELQSAPSIRRAVQSVGERFKHLEGQLKTLETRVEVGFATLRADMVKWLFGMWITLLGAMVALTKLG